MGSNPILATKSIKMSADKYKKKHQKKNKYPKMSGTKGILKGESCRKTQLKTRGAKDSRFHKTDPTGYRLYEIEIHKMNNTPLPEYLK